MFKEKRILSYILGWLILGYIILFIGTSNVFADTYESFDVTWYYRNKSDESTLLNVIKNEDTPLYASTNEYVNGYTTRIEQTFNKDMQYVINYNLRMSFSPEQELNYRSDTLQRIIDYSFVDNDFKILNVTATENWNRSSSSGNTALTIKVSMQIMALNNTNAIKFGVYTTNNISIGFYNHTDQIDYYILDNININDNSNGTIIDQNNQIIQGQDDINQSIIDGNKETQDVIKDQFNECKSYDYILSSNNDLFTSNIGFLNETGSITGYTSWRYTDYITINNNKTYNITLNYDGNGSAYCLYNQDKSLIGCYLYNNERNINISNNNANYIRFSYYANINYPNNKTTFTGEYCSNRIDETNDKLDGIQGALTDSSPTDMSGLGNSAGWLPAGPVDSILTLPLTMLNNLVSNLSSNKCQTAVLQLPYVKKNINLPCIKTLYDKMGITGTLFQSAGLIASAFILFNYLLKLYQWVDNTLTMRENTMPGYFEDNWGGGA